MHGGGLSRPFMVLRCLHKHAAAARGDSCARRRGLPPGYDWASQISNFAFAPQSGMIRFRGLEMLISKVLQECLAD